MEVPLLSMIAMLSEGQCVASLTPFKSFGGLYGFVAGCDFRSLQGFHSQIACQITSHFKLIGLH